MNDRVDPNDPFAGLWASVIRYPAMLGGTVAGQFVGIALDAVVGTRTPWIPLACSVVCEALVGVRFGGPAGTPLRDPSQCLRVSTTYSLALFAVSLPLLVWVVASHADAVQGGVGLSFVTPTLLGVGVAALVAATLARAGIMLAITRSRR
jgi:hypothetical protein